MKIRRLRIRRMPGFPDGGPALADLAGGLNVIVGPNASGKTTICRAIRGLLWPETLKGFSPVSVEGTWSDGEQTLLTDLEAERRTCQRDGARADGPALPPADRARCFTVTIDDLFDGSDGDLAAEISREMAGGYDLARIRDEATDFKIGRARNDNKILQQARRDARNVSREHEALHGEENGLAELEARAAEAAAAAGRLARIQDAGKLLGLRGEIAAAETDLKGFPGGMARLRGNEADALAELREDLDSIAAKLRTADGAADDASRAQAEADLGEEGIAPVRLAEQLKHLTALRDAERDLAQARQTVAQAEIKRTDALRQLGEAANPDKIDAIDVSGLDEVETLHDEFAAVRANLREVDAKLDLLAGPEPTDEIGDLERGVGILREWLECGPAGVAIARRNAALVWILAAMLAVTALTFAILVDPWWAALVVPAAAAAAMARTGGAVARPGLRDDSRARFARTALEAPEAWTPEAVGRRIAEIEQAIVQAREAERREGERRSVQHRRDQLTEQVNALEAKRGQLAEQFGVAPGTGVFALRNLAESLRAYREATTALKQAGRIAEEADAGRQGRLKKINDFLEEFALEGCESSDVAETRLAHIRQRADQHAEAKSNLAAARREADEARQTAAKLEARKRDLFQAAGLADDDDATLAERLERLGDYRLTERRLGDLKTQTAALAARLGDAADLADMTAEQIDREAARLETLAARHEELVGQIKEIELKVRQAGSGHRLADALAAVDRAEAAVARRRTEAIAAAAAQFLLDEIEAEYRVESEPEVLARARDWFARFTHHRYELQAEPGGPDSQPTFRAIETTTGRGLGLDELSRGTRMQLLLAVRLAFAAAAEAGTQLPFILDEVLSSSDPERFRAIVECLLVLVGEGRQVFYFTCQPGDAEAWREAAEAEGITDARLIDLGDVRRSGVVAEPLSEPTIRVPDVPAPAGAGLDAYAAALGAAPLDPTTPAAGAHLAHLVDDAEQLHALAKARIETVGQLRSLADHARSDAYIAPDALARVLARADLVDAFADAWAVGRGRPVTREDLTAAGVTETFIDGVTDMARELDWDAGRLIAAIEARGDDRTKGFRAGTLERMKDRFLESGHLSAEETLGEDTARGRVLAAANEHVNSGVLAIDEVGRLLTTWWRMCADREQTE